jgi:hypothetical protein
LTLAHGKWICIKALLHRFEQMLMLQIAVDVELQENRGMV